MILTMKRRWHLLQFLEKFQFQFLLCLHINQSQLLPSKVKPKLQEQQVKNSDLYFVLLYYFLDEVVVGEDRICVILYYYLTCIVFVDEFSFL